MQYGNAGFGVKRIAIVRALHLGDLLLSVPAWRAIREAFPKAEITLIGLSWARDFIPRFGYIDRFLEFPGFPGMLEVDCDETRLARFVQDARAYRYDLAFQMHGSGEASAKFTAALGAACSIGYEPQSNERSLDYGLAYPHGIKEVFRNLRLVEFLTGRTGDPRLEFPILAEDERGLQAIHELKGLALKRFVGINPGARSPARRWMPERFAAVADLLAERYGLMPMITGGPGEVEIATAVAEAMRAPSINLAARTTIGELGALISRASLFISNDSGPAHIAAALGTLSVAIFGPADPLRWAPLDQARHRFIYRKVECSPCSFWECPIDHRCLTGIRPEAVLAVAHELLREQKAA